jgi:aryl-alcohol dehydrogenase-like predicted oxidoreductase
MSKKEKRESGLKSGTTRRDFVKVGVAGAAGLTVGQRFAGSSQASAQHSAPHNPRTAAAMPMRNLGKTGYKVGIFSLGGQATIEKPGKEAEAVAIANRAIDLGVNYFDTAARYGGDDQWSQKYLGKVIKHRREEVFLATKTHDRTYDGSMRLLESSLKQLNTDHLDIWQLHNISRTEQLDHIFAKDGAIHAMENWTPPPADQQNRWQRASGPGTLKMKEALEYVLTLAVSTVIIGCDDIAQLEENVQIASQFNPLSEEQAEKLVAQTEDIKRQALFFRSWEA